VPQSEAVALGVGGAGNDLLSHVMDLEIQGLRCIAVDTDQYSLHIAQAHSKFLIAPEDGTGTRGDIETGRKLGLQASHELQPNLRRAKVVFVLAGMGGGTGGGAAPVIAEYARKNGALVIGLVTKPFQFERGRFSNAVESTRRMVNTCDTVVLIDNHVAEQTSMTLPFGLSLDSAGQSCCSIVQSLVHTFAESCRCSAELGELRTMLRRGGLAKAGVGHSHSHLGVEEASLRAIRNTMAHDDLAGASGIFINITGGKRIQQACVESAVELFSRKIDSSAQLFYGHRTDATMLGLTRATLLATGISFPFSWRRFRNLQLDLFDLEPDSTEEEDLGLKLELHQIERC
jgi:cell division protein FtsZ